ncbi:MAG: alpha-xylosidase [Ruminococcaceae bacterium]|nr:alpha-xylosidase [Oscillospiraceae bacterium]
MLNKHLLVKTEPLAKKENLVFFKDYRITLIFDRLFRIEKNVSGKFCDDATQSVWYRNMPPVVHTVTSSEDSIEIKTASVTLHMEADLEDSYVLIDGVRTPVSNDGNLLGTTRTLDQYSGDINIKNNQRLTLGTGVCSRTGVAVVDDTESLRLLDDGALAEAWDNEFDLYVFAYGKAYREAVKALYAITGSTPMLPRYAFGNWWSRYHVYTDEEYIDLMDSFEKYGIPLTVATVDMDWHYSTEIKKQKRIVEEGKISEERGTAMANIGWTGYSWNTDLFPDYKQFLRDLQNRNLKVTLNLHPADGVRYFEDMYEEMALAMGVDPKTEAVVEFDIANDHFVNKYFEILHHPYERDGVDFWWIDWQQGTKSAMAGLDPLWALNHYHYYDNGRDGKHALIMSRYAGIGSHRYPIGFSGDTAITWKTLAYMPYFTATSANVGYSWWGHDIGGHYYGEKDDELYLRFLQFGVFNPINRLHCCNSEILTKEPWAYRNGIGELSREAMVLRHRMIPMLHTANYRTHAEGEGLIEPMYYEYPDCEAAYEANGQYIFAKDYIVAPIAKHSEADGLTSVKVWIPEGKWTDLFTNDVYNIEKGGRWVTLVRSLDSIPVLAKDGAVLPLGNDEGNSVSNPKSLEFLVFNGNNTYRLYEDDEKGVAAFTVVENNSAEGKASVRFHTEGNSSVLPENRSVTLTFKEVVMNTPMDVPLNLPKKMQADVTVKKNGEPIEAKVEKYGTVKVTIENVDYTAEYDVTVEYDVLPELTRVKRDVLMKLLVAEGAFTNRNNLYKNILKVESVADIAASIEISDMSPLEKQRLTEALDF